MVVKKGLHRGYQKYTATKELPLKIEPGTSDALLTELNHLSPKVNRCKNKSEVTYPQLNASNTSVQLQKKNSINFA